MKTRLYTQGALSAFSHAVLSLSLLLTSTCLFAQNTFTYLPGNGNWSDAARWDCGGCGHYPGEISNNDIVIISNSSGTIDLDVTVTVQDYTHNTSSTLNQNGMNTLTVTGDFTWNSGTVRAMVNCTGNMNFGTGTQLLQQRMTVSGTTSTLSNSSFNISSSGSNLGQFVNNGTFNWSGGLFTITAGSDGFQNNSVFNVNFNGTISGSTATLFANNGTFNKTMGSDALVVNSKFENNGTFTCSSGTSVEFRSGLDNNNGAIITGNAGSTISINGVGTLASGSSITGAQTLNLSGGVIVNQAPDAAMDLGFVGNAVTWNVVHSTANVIMAGSNLTVSGSGSLTATSSLLFQRVILQIPVTVSSGATCTINDGIGGSRLITTGGVLDLQGTTNLTSGVIQVNNTGDLNNSGTLTQTGGTINLTSSLAMDNTSNYHINMDAAAISGTGNLNNSGALTRGSGTGTVTIAATTTNTGTINHNTSGALEFNGGLTNASGGIINVTASGTITGDGGSLATGSALNGSGTLRVANGFTVDQSISSGFDLDFFGGSVNWNIDYTSANVIMSGNGLTISGSGSLEVTSSLLFQRIILQIPTTVISGATCTINSGAGGSRQVSNSGDLQLMGTTTMTGGILDLFSSGSMSNSGSFTQTSGTLNISAGATFSNTGSYTLSMDGSAISGTGTFDNTGSFIRSGGTGALTIVPTFNNQGTFRQSVAGQISLSGAFTNSGGIEGIGSMSFTSLSQLSNITPGLSPGILGFNQLNNGSGAINIELQGSTTPGTDYDQIQVTGAATLSGTLNISFLNAFQPSIGNQFTIMTCNPCNIGSLTINHPGTNPNAFSVGVVGNSIVLTMDQALPVELLFFEASQKENAVQLKWATATEINNEGFEIQRSPDAVNWKTINFQKGAGTSHQVQHYSVLDDEPLTGTNYYRLKQMDYDENYEYSSVIMVNLNREKHLVLSAFPNPAADDFFNLQLSGLDPEMEAILLLIDQTGRLVWKGILPPQKTNEQIPAHTFSPGRYTVQVQQGGKFAATHLIVD